MSVFRETIGCDLVPTVEKIVFSAVIFHQMLFPYRGFVCRNIRWRWEAGEPRFRRLEITSPKKHTFGIVEVLLKPRLDVWFCGPTDIHSFAASIFDLVKAVRIGRRICIAFAIVYQ